VAQRDRPVEVREAAEEPQSDDPDRPERAEIAFAIADATQHNGLGTILLSQLSGAAEQARIAVLSAEVLPQNHRMLHVFRDCGFPLTTRTLPGAVLVELATSRSSATPDAVQPSQVRAADNSPGSAALLVRLRPFQTPGDRSRHWEPSPQRNDVPDLSNAYGVTLLG
jgi:hypothetical protein